jgi:hypothetical protein
MTNVRGNSPSAMASFGATTDQGLRTLAGGQLSIQVEGYLAIQTDAAPPLMIDATVAPRDIFAVVNEAPEQVSGDPAGTDVLHLKAVAGIDAVLRVVVQ